MSASLLELVVLYSYPGHWVWDKAPLSSLDTASLLFFILHMPTARSEAKVRFSHTMSLAYLQKRLYMMKGKIP